MNWAKATDIILLASIAVLGLFALLGLCQWIHRRSLSRVDEPILKMIPILIILTITYFVFDKFIVLNVRPDGTGESSFPSTHVLVVATIFSLTIFALPRYIKSKTLRTILILLMIGLTAFVAVGRVLANKHWPSDVVGALIISAINGLIYYFIIDKKEE